MGLAYRAAVPAVSLVQDQDVYLADEDKSDLTITVIGAAEKGVKIVTDVHVLQAACRKSRYLQPIIDISDDPTEITRWRTQALGYQQTWPARGRKPRKSTRNSRTSP